MTGQFLITLLAGLPWTIALTSVVFLTGAIVGMPLCLILTSRRRLLQWIGRAIVLILRSIPPIVWLFFIFFGIGSGIIEVSPFEAAWIGLGLITSANMAEIYRGAFAAIHPGQYEAALALGLPAHDRFKDVIAPQLLRVALPSAGTYAIGLLKDTAIASTIGVNEIAFEAYHLSQRTFHSLDIFAIAALLYILMSLPIAWFSYWADGTMRRRIAR